jgi:hypothetical protein
MHLKQSVLPSLAYYIQGSSAKLGDDIQSSDPAAFGSLGSPKISKLNANVNPNLEDRAGGIHLSGLLNKDFCECAQLCWAKGWVLSR